MSPDFPAMLSNRTKQKRRSSAHKVSKLEVEAMGRLINFLKVRLTRSRLSVDCMQTVG
jgi:hypothetical protein